MSLMKMSSQIDRLFRGVLLNLRSDEWVILIDEARMWICHGGKRE